MRRKNAFSISLVRIMLWSKPFLEKAWSKLFQPMRQLSKWMRRKIKVANLFADYIFAITPEANTVSEPDDCLCKINKNTQPRTMMSCSPLESQNLRLLFQRQLFHFIASILLLFLNHLPKWWKKSMIAISIILNVRHRKLQQWTIPLQEHSVKKHTLIFQYAIESDHVEAMP